MCCLQLGGDTKTGVWENIHGLGAEKQEESDYLDAQGWESSLTLDKPLRQSVRENEQ